jgi:hypothetical protein
MRHELSACENASKITRCFSGGADPRVFDGEVQADLLLGSRFHRNVNHHFSAR